MSYCVGAGGPLKLLPKVTRTFRLQTATNPSLTQMGYHAKSVSSQTMSALIKGNPIFWLPWLWAWGPYKYAHLVGVLQCQIWSL